MAHPVLIGGKWIESNSTQTFQPTNPATAATIDEQYPVSGWQDCEAALASAAEAFGAMRNIPESRLAEFLETFADRIDSRSEEICAIANLETALPVKPRLADVELPRTSNQLRQAADAVRNATWQMPTIDTNTGIRSIYGALGPVAVFGPNNFPLAFGSISGGDFAAAVAAGNPVIAKANSSHPGTTRLIAEEAQKAASDCNLPDGFVQMIYRTSHSDGERLVADSRLAAVGYTGSRNAGLRLKEIADKHGKPIYLELSSINPVFILPGAVQERGEEIATELSGSCLLGTGQFCTSPGLIVLVQGSDTDAFVESFVSNVDKAANGLLLSPSVQSTLIDAVNTLTNAGADIKCGGTACDNDGVRFRNTVLQVDGTTFLKQPGEFQTEAFGNASLIAVVSDIQQAVHVAKCLEGNLTGTIYSCSNNSDDEAYQAIEPELRQKVGRLLNDKMPTGVAVSIAMNHGGPFPATGHPGFTAVGMPDSIRRFSMLQCYDNVRMDRLPNHLKDENPDHVVRRINGVWTDEFIGAQV